MSTYYLNMKWLFSFSLLDLDRFLSFPSGLHCTCFLSFLPWPGWWRIHAHQLSASALARGLAKNSLALCTSLLSYYESDESDSVLSMTVDEDEDEDDDDDDDDDDPIGAKSPPQNMLTRRWNAPALFGPGWLQQCGQPKRMKKSLQRSGWCLADCGVLMCINEI